MPQRETVAGEATARSWTSNIMVMLWKLQKERKEDKDLFTSDMSFSIIW